MLSGKALQQLQKSVRDRNYTADMQTVRDLVNENENGERLNWGELMKRVTYTLFFSGLPDTGENKLNAFKLAHAIADNAEDCSGFSIEEQGDDSLRVFFTDTNGLDNITYVYGQDKKKVRKAVIALVAEAILVGQWSNYDLWDLRHNYGVVDHVNTYYQPHMKSLRRHIYLQD